MTKVAMIGCGKLGQDCAEVMAEYYDVVGYDVEPRSPAFPMCSTIQEAVSDRDLIFIAAPTPHAPVYGGETPTSHLPNQDFDYTIVMDILNEVNKHVNQNQLVVLISTVLPGTVRNYLRPCITNARFIYNPYLIAMGTVKWDMVNPEMLIIGTEDGSVTGDAEELINFYKPMMKNDPRYELGTWDEAESIKIFYNTFISTKVALVNMIQDVAERSGNINVDVVTGALARSTQRIMGPAYMKAGMGDGGACHPRDNIALRYLAERLDLGYDLFDAIMKAREVQAENLALRCLKNGRNITIIGKAYKPNVSYTNGSSSLLVGHYIEKHGGNVHYYDVNTGETDLRNYWTDVYLIGYWDENLENNVYLPNWVTVIDPWRKELPRQVSINTLISYGNTRPHNTYQNAENHSENIKLLYHLVPKLEQVQDQIHYIAASCNHEHAFQNVRVELLVQQIEEQLALGKTKFVFDGREEDFKEGIVIKMHIILKLLGDKVKASDFYYMVCTDKCERDYEALAERFGWTDKIQFVCLQHFQFHARNHLTKLNEVEYKIGNKDKKFVCFNKVCRPHRTILLENMLREDLVKDSFYSFFNYTPDYPSWYNGIDQLPDYFYSIKANKELFPLKLNISEERHNPADTTEEDFYYTDNSYFSLVTETVYFTEKHENWPYEFVGNTIFFSEKIFKPIIMKHPFVLVSRPGSLRKLRDMGFRTLSPYINESYDDIQDDTERMNAIVAEVKRLCSLSAEQWIEIQTGLKDTIEYNYELLKNSNVFMDASDLAKLLG
jgi:UDPglucose 6-dehydrogenase